MNVRFQSSGRKLSLGKGDFLSEGGEGKVYVRGDLAIKIYEDPTKTIRAEKVKELVALDRFNIARPIDLVIDMKNRPVGYAMKRIDNAEPLCRLFTNDFRKQVGISEESIKNLVAEMAATLTFIHSKNCLVVDFNEMNILAGGGNYEKPFFIDVDSYQTPNFAAAAIMPSIRDPHAQQFTVETDWYSFAIVAFTLFVGVHPFKGTHPDFKRGDFVGRMAANISAFNPKVRLPIVSRGIESIPVAYRDWMESVFERAERSVPPSEMGGVTEARKAAQRAAVDLVIELLFEGPSEIINFTNGWVQTSAGLMDMNKRAFRATMDAVPVKTATTKKTVIADISKGCLNLAGVDGEKLELNIYANKLLSVEGELFVVGDDCLQHVELSELNGRIIPSIGPGWPIHQNARKVFDGIIFQDLFGVPHITVPYIDAKSAVVCQTLKIQELSGYKVVEAKHEGGVVVLVGSKDGLYDSFTLKFDKKWEQYRCEVEGDVPYHKPNFTVLPNGVVAKIDHGGELVLFTRHSDAIKRISDPSITGDMKLFRHGSSVVAAIGNKLITIKTKG